MASMPDAPGKGQGRGEGEGQGQGQLQGIARQGSMTAGAPIVAPRYRPPAVRPRSRTNSRATG